MTPSAKPSELWQRYCKYVRHYPQIGITLDISRIRFPETFLTEMTGAVTTAIKEMRELEQGAIANADEERMVGHYWLRTPSLSPTPEIKSEIEKTGREIKAFAQAVRSGEIRSGTGKEFRTVLVIGIGGSALGPQLIYDALGIVDDPINVVFCDNTDPDGIIRLLQTLEGALGETLVLVISKSGGTPETRNGALELAHAFKCCGLNFAKNAVAITSAGSKLDALATEEGWLARFPMWDWVGGRTSLFSSVGLVPAALHGADLDAFINGASAMDEVTRNPELLENPAALLAASWFYEGDGKGKKDMVILPYKDRLMLMSKYLQQLVMESLGKERDRDDKVVNQGIAVYGNKGSTDQHAYVQQLREGVNNFFATFIEVLRDSSDTAALKVLAEVEPNTTSGDYLNGFLLGTRTALYENGRDSVTITLEELSAKTVGALIALYERAVGFYASFVNINAYHQPGVEAGKKAAAQVLALQKKAVAELKKTASDKRGISAGDLAKAIGATDDVETIYKILSHLAANTGRGVVAEGDIAPERRLFRAA